MAERLERKAGLLDRAASQVEQAAARLSQKAEQIDALQAQLASLDLWTRPEPGSRRPRFSRDEIARTAVRIADAEGFEGVSMRRLAQALDAGTMTLYHYVRTKEELFALVNDAVMAEVLVPDGELPAAWRPAITTIARRSRDSIRRHPWALDLRFEGPPGPNSVRHFDQSLRAVESTGVPFEQRLDLVLAVDEYVFGHCLLERTSMATADRPVMASIERYVDTLLDSGDYPGLAQIRHEHGRRGAWQMYERVASDPTRFDRNLEHLLDGFAARFPSP